MNLLGLKVAIWNLLSSEVEVSGVNLKREHESITTAKYHSELAPMETLCWASMLRE